MDLLAAFLEAVLRTATPLAIAALGETVSERVGVINVGLEGAIICGCLGAALGASTLGVTGALVLAVAAGLVPAVVFGGLTIGLRTDQIITGTALTLGSYGLTGVLYRVAFGTAGAALTIPTLPLLELPGLSRLPLLGRALFHQSVLTYALYVLVPLVWWGLYRTRAGLGLRAIGERPVAAEVAGLAIDRYRWFGILTGGALGGLAGAALVMQAGTFSEQMSAGRGFMALAIVALGRWTPQGTVLAALLFGAASALQYQFQARGSAVPYQVFLAIPYVLTLVVLGGGLGRARAPAALGRPDAPPR